MGRINTGGAKKRSGDNIAIASTVSGTTLKLTPPKGYYDGSTGLVTITDGDFIAENIRENINLFGKLGSLKELKSEISDTLVISESTIESSYNTIGTSATKKAFTFNTKGNYRVSFNLKSNNNLNNVSLVGFINGVETYLSTTYNGTAYSANINMDITVNQSDLLELKIRNSANGYIGYVNNVKVKSILAVTKTIDIV
jgi:hypothetical protein